MVLWYCGVMVAVGVVVFVVSWWWCGGMVLWCGGVVVLFGHQGWQKNDLAERHVFNSEMKTAWLCW
jgi:hypothetical protein